MGREEETERKTVRDKEGRERERHRERTYLLVYFPNGCIVGVRPGQSQETEASLKSPVRVAVAQTCGPSSISFPDILADS